MSKARRDYYQEITDAIAAELESGVKPWSNFLIRSGGMARNYLTKKAYRGINVLTTAVSAMKNDFKSSWWLTLKQANEMGGRVKRGSKGTPIYVWKWTEKEVEGQGGEKETQRRAFLRCYSIFNADQIEGIEFGEAQPRSEVQTIEAAEAILEGMSEKPSIEFAGLQPAYFPQLDVIRMPEASEFTSDAQYYKTLFHEIGHWTGHEARLARPGITAMGKGNREQYAREELVAEIASAFLAAEAGLPEVEGIQESATYISAYLELIREDKKALVMAASQAQKVADFVLGNRMEGEGSGEEVETA